MLQKLRELIKIRPTEKKTDSGQIAIILILIIAVSLIFFAATMNFGNVSMAKVRVTIASNTGAALLVSQMSSYGQFLFKSMLGGKPKLCGPTGLAYIFLNFLMPFFGSILLSPILTKLLGIQAFKGAKWYHMIILSSLSLYMLPNVIKDQMISRRWNGKMKSGMTSVDTFIEQAISTGLSKAVDDQATVPDLWDLDQDTLYGYTGTDADDTIGRYAAYYDYRISKPDLSNLDLIDDFLDGLKEFVYDDPFNSTTPDHWGIYDPVECASGCCYDQATNPSVPSVCNPCCVPADYTDIASEESGDTLPLRPASCDSGDTDEIGVSTTCETNSLYPDTDSSGLTTEGYRYTYDPFYENHVNNFYSFRERLGTDDEDAGSSAFYADKEDPGGLNPNIQYAGRPFGQIRVGSSSESSLVFPQSGAYTDKQDYRIQDASGYFRHQDYQLFQLCQNECAQHPEYCYLESETSATALRPLPSGHGILPVEPSSLYNFGGATFGGTGESCNFWISTYITPIMASLISGGHYIDLDSRLGVFPFFYKIADWGLDLSESTDAFENGTFNDTKNYEWCGWYDSRYTDPSMAASLNPPCAPSAQILPEELRLRPLLLPNDPYSATVKFNITPYVDGENKDVNGNMVPLKVDNVKVPSANPLIADDDVCAEDLIFDTPKVGFWKKGGGYYCALQDDDSSTPGTVTAHWPYNYDCAKHGQDASGGFLCEDPEWADENGPAAVPCQCNDYDGSPGFTSGISASNFPEDVLDEIVHGLPAFLAWAEALLDHSNKYNKQTFRQWYAHAAEWIEPGTAAAPLGHSADCMDSSSDYPAYVCNDEDGALWKYYEWIKEIRTRLMAFRAATFSGGCTDAWCGTSNSSCYATSRGDPDLIWPDEAATMGTVTIDDVIACLDHNVTTDGGNAERFRRCSNSCKALNDWIDIIKPDADDLPPNPSDVTAAVAAANDASRDCADLVSSSSVDPWNGGRNFLPRSLVFDSTHRRFNPTGDMFEVQDDILHNFIPCESQCYTQIHTAQENLEECIHDGHTLPESLPGCITYNLPSSPTVTNPNGWSMASSGTGSGVANISCFELWRGLEALIGPFPGSIATDWPIYPYTVSCSQQFGVCGVSQCNTLSLPQERQDCNNCFGYADQIYSACETACNTLYTPTPPPCEARREYSGNPAIGSRDFSPSPNTISVDCLDPLFKQHVTEALAEGLGSCNLSTKCPTCPSPGPSQDSFIQLLDDSIPEAENQVTKFRRRSDFLRIIRQNLNNVLMAFDDAEAAFRNFLMCGTVNPTTSDDGPACALTKFMIDNPDTGLPFQAVYGWQGEPPTDRPPPDGTTQVNQPYVHIVKVEARLPDRCDNRCNFDQTDYQHWPYVKAYSEDWGTLQCYKISRKNGTVKFRVTRYDEPTDSKKVTFPNGLPLWNFKQTNPDRKFSSLPSDAQLPYHLFDAGICTSTALQLAAPTGLPLDLYGGAFLMDQRIVSGDASEDNHVCWDKAHYLLSQGVSTETCARYYWGSDEEGFVFKFVPCKPF